MLRARPPMRPRALWWVLQIRSRPRPIMRAPNSTTRLFFSLWYPPCSASIQFTVSVMWDLNRQSVPRRTLELWQLSQGSLCVLYRCNHNKKREVVKCGVVDDGIATLENELFEVWTNRWMIQHAPSRLVPQPVLQYPANDTQEEERDLDAVNTEMRVSPGISGAQPKWNPRRSHGLRIGPGAASDGTAETGVAPGHRMGSECGTGPGNDVSRCHRVLMPQPHSGPLE
jgi:hypothetical protein